jgi:predicted DNA-binding protein
MTKFPEVLTVALPAGTRDRLNNKATREATTQAALMRQAILRALREPAAGREPAQEVAA